MLQHHTYFDERVQSLGFTRHGRKASVGVILPGEYHFGTQAPERMTVVSGECRVRPDGHEDCTTYAQGSSFEIAGDSGFTITVSAPTAYLCEYL